MTYPSITKTVGLNHSCMLSLKFNHKSITFLTLLSFPFQPQGNNNIRTNLVIIQEFNINNYFKVISKGVDMSGIEWTFSQNVNKK